MKATFKDQDPVHLGNNVRRIREIIGVKQFELAEKCNWSQQLMSRLENSDIIDHEHLETIAKSLGVMPEFIENFREERAVNNVINYDNSTFQDNVIPIAMNSPVFHLSSAENLSELIEKFIRDELQKSQSLAELGKVVLDLVEEVKKLKAAGK